MASKRPPFILYVWMFCTRLFAVPGVALAWVLHRRMGGEPERFAERLGHANAPDTAPVIWFHAASLGEVMQIAPLAQNLAQTEKSKVLVTTTTATSAAWVAREMPEALHRFAPIDTTAAVKRFLDGWSISAAIFVEGDLWPRLLAGLEDRGVPRILLNARHSRTRARLPAVYATLLASFSLVTCRSETVAQEMLSLGVASDRVHILPDLRLTLPKLAVADEALTSVSDAFGARAVWLAASTHPSDEEAVLTAHSEVLAANPNAMLILAPRHPKRGQPLEALAHAKKLTTARRSLGEDVTPATQVYIADTLGELGVFFSLSPIVFLGGSIGQEGGHNPYEPANFGSALLYGPNVKNFVEAYDALRLAGAAEQIAAPEQLGGAVLDLMRSDQAETMGQAGLAYMAETQNCTSRTATLITQVLKRAGGRT